MRINPTRDRINEQLLIRDKTIAAAYLSGTEQKELATLHGLAEKTIYNILIRMRAFRDGETHKQWGPTTVAMWEARDLAIQKAHRDGIGIDVIAQRWCLSHGRVVQIIKCTTKGPTMHKHHKLDVVEEQAARFGIFKRRMSPDFRQVSWLVKCANCPAEYAASWGPSMNIDGMIKFTKQRGWDIAHGERPLCPTCAHTGKTAPLAKPNHQSFRPHEQPPSLYPRLLDEASYRVEQENRAAALAQAVEAEKQAQASAPPTAPAEATAEAPAPAHASPMPKGFPPGAVDKGHTPEARAKAVATRQQRIAEREHAHKQNGIGTHVSPQPKEDVMNMQPTVSPKIMHAVFRKLDEMLDAEQHLYRNGYSDARVAADCCTDVDVVAHLRTETFGELAEDPRISRLRGDVEQLQLLLADTLKQLEQISHA